MNNIFFFCPCMGKMYVYKHMHIISHNPHVPIGHNVALAAT